MALCIELSSLFVIFAKREQTFANRGIIFVLK